MVSPGSGELQPRTVRRERDRHRARFILDCRRRGMRYADIGEMCDPPITAQRVHQIYTRELQLIPQTAFHEYRTEHRDRLEYLIQRFEEIAHTFMPLVQGGKIVVDPRNGEPLRDIRPAMEALREIRATSESLRRLDGVDAPQRQQVEAVQTVRHVIVGVDLDKL
jgi:hypothetical protein